VVIGTVGSAAKAEQARRHGADHVLLYRDVDVAAEVRALTGGKGVPVVYDGVGKDTFPASLDCLSQRGTWVCYGASSGAVPPFDIMLLAQKGSLYATRPTLATYAAKREDLVAMAGEVLELALAGKIVSEPRQQVALKDAANAHVALQSRATSGATILVP
jgi:NADPH2:quinone reductase